MNVTFYKELQKSAEDIVKYASKMLLAMQRKAVITHHKDEGDFATTADLASEKYILDQIHRKFPKHGILSEEFGSKNSANDYIWVVDPLDGTKEYAAGLNDFGCLIAVEYKGRTVVGVTNLVRPHEFYSSVLGGQTFVNERPIYVSDTEFGLSTISFHMPTRKNSTSEISASLNVLESLIGNAYRVRGNFNDASALGLVAQGFYAAHVISPDGPKWWDVAGSLLQVEVAGGKITDWRGREIKNRDLSFGVIASNSLIHDKIVHITSSAL